MRRPLILMMAFAILGSGCLASNQETSGNRLGADGGSRDPRSRRDSGVRDIGFDGVPTEDGGIPEYTWDDDVESIVIAKCQRCHGTTPSEGAPYAIVTYTDTQLDSLIPGVVRHAQMASRVQNVAAPMPPNGVQYQPTPPALTVDERAILVAWSLGGALESRPDAGLLPDTGVVADGGAGVDASVDPDSGVVDTGIIGPLAGIGSLTTVNAGYLLAEGTAWSATDGILYFSDVNSNVVYQLTPPSTITDFRRPSNNTNGVAIDNMNRLLTTEYGSRSVTRRDGNMFVNVTTQFNGMTYNSPNDVLARPSDGTIYFTDPAFGLGGRPREISFNGLYRIEPGGNVSVEWMAMTTESPNGLGITQDETILYVSDFTNDFVYAFDIAAGGALSNQRLFVNGGINQPDGIAVDDDGNVFVAAAGGVYVYAPGGTLWGQITINGAVTNLCFGGTNRTTLYITSRNTLYSIQLTIPGGT